MRLAAPVLAVALAVAAVPAPAAALERVTAALHVHSDASTGDLGLDELAAAAERQGLDALLLAENYLLRIEYGIPPFRALTRATREERSVLATGLEAYLARLAATRARFPRVILVPGFEVLPHYHWTGSPAMLELTVHNTQKNLLVFGVTDPLALRTLPATGNRQAGAYSWQSVVDLLPGLLVVPGVVLLVRRRTQRRRLGRAVVVVKRRRWLAGSLLVAVAVLAVARAWPFTSDRYPPWEDFGLEPHQAVIDHVDRLGGATVWSFPEAADAGEQQVGPVRVSWRTEPYPDDLLRTFRYTAFGAVYEQATRSTQPGGRWDRLLGQYAAGERSRPAWAVAESGFHGLGTGKRLGTVRTVFLVEERAEAALLDALRRGRMYALSRTADASLELAEFTVAAPEGQTLPGDTLRLRAGAPIEVRIGVVAAAGARQDVRVTLVRSGAAVGAWAGATPFRVVHRETFDGAPAYFRLDVRGQGAAHHLLTNPIFVRTP